MTPDRVKQLAATYPIPSEAKLERRMSRLARMERFYTEKQPDAPEKQAKMFGEFVNALRYAQTTLKIYRKLTKEIADEARTDSES